MKQSSHMLRAALWLVIAPGGVLASPWAFASDQGIAFFEREVRPVLVEHCYECHSAEAEKLRGGLYLDSRPGWQSGGDSGPALVADEPGQSLLVHAIEYGDDDLKMPPKQKLPQADIDVLIKWIAMGAPDPRGANTADRLQSIDLEEGRKFWSFQPVEKPVLPEIDREGWGANEVDRFILSRLEEQGLEPAPLADRHTLLRRLYIDLTGLPPTPEQIREHDDGEVTAIVDELISSPRFGERWGRHWLDLARYADSSGGGASRVFPDAWKYRDYVIRSFNNDLPFDRFVTQQVAGDLLAFDGAEERYENFVATGFLVLGPRNYINDDEEAFHLDGADEQLDTVGRVFLGMTLGCVRCHDHKFDPIPMDDYYALAGIFTSTETSDPIPSTTNFEWNDVADPRADPDGNLLQDYERAFARYREIAKRYSRMKSAPDADAEEIEALNVERLAAQKAVPKKPATLMAVVDAAKIGDEKLRVRGNPHQSAQSISRSFLQVLMSADEPRPVFDGEESGRRQLAAWITSPSNPLTSRVYVNRVWAQLMGRGLVVTVDNFGTRGEAPSHPELLDWLATWFDENGRSTKRLVRLIVTSKAYRLGEADADSRLVENDPENRWFGRHLRRSLDAEALRDSILLVSGDLQLEGAPEPFSSNLKNEFNYDFDADQRRSVFLPRFRNNLPEIFETFDVANPAIVVGRRDQTILSPQALFLINNEFVTEQARKAADEILALDISSRERVRHAWLRTLAREPVADEVDLLVDFLDKATAEGENDADARRDPWAAIVQSLYGCVDFRFVR